MDGLLWDVVAALAAQALAPAATGLGCAAFLCGPALVCTARGLHARAALSTLAPAALAAGPRAAVAAWAALALVSALPRRRHRVRVPRGAYTGA